MVPVLLALGGVLTLSAVGGRIRRPRMGYRRIVELQLEALLRGDVSVAYKLASPGNRRHTAGDGYDRERFYRMVKTSFAPMLRADAYELYDDPATQGSVVALLFKKRRLLIGYEFTLSRQTDEDTHESLEEFKLPRNSRYWRTDSVRPLTTFESRQLQFRKRCFGPAWHKSKISHSFGVDRTHNMCCQLGPNARAMSHNEGNLRNDPSHDVYAVDRSTRWPTCMGSNVCGDYAERAGDNTKPVFATNQDLTRVALHIAPTRDCDALAARMLHARAHRSPGIETRGNPNACTYAPHILTTQAEIDEWLASGGD